MLRGAARELAVEYAVWAEGEGERRREEALRTDRAEQMEFRGPEMRRYVREMLEETRRSRSRSRSRSNLMAAISSPRGRADLMRQLRDNREDNMSPVLSTRQNMEVGRMGVLARSLDTEVEAACTGVFDGDQLLAEFHKLRILAEIRCKYPWCSVVIRSGLRDLWSNNWIVPGRVW